MDTDKPILKEVAQALYNDDFNTFKQTVMPLLNFDEADEAHAPTSSNPDVGILLKNFCDEEDGYKYNHLDLLEAPDPYFLCEWVNDTQDPSPCPDYDEWLWERIDSMRANAQTLSFYDSMYDEHTALIETLNERYGDACVKAQQNEWLIAFYDHIHEELNENNVLFYPRRANVIDEDVSKFLHFLPRAKEGTFKGMLSRSEYKFLLQIKVDYDHALDQFKQSQLYRNAAMVGLYDEALAAFEDAFHAQYDLNNANTVNIASENNVIEKLTLALQSFDDVTTTAITKSDLWRGSDYITYPSLDEIAQTEGKQHTLEEILPNGEMKLFNTYEIKATPAEFICLEELLDHLPYTNGQVLDCIKLCCDSTKPNSVDKILSQLACNLCDYQPYDENFFVIAGCYEDIGFHFVEGTDLEKALKQFHAEAQFDYISFGKQVAENNAYCVGKYGYIPHYANSAEKYPACQFTKSDVCILGKYVAGVLGTYTPLVMVSKDGNSSTVSADEFVRPLLQKLENCGITLKDVPDYVSVHAHEQEKPCAADVFTSTLDAAEKQAARENTHRPGNQPPTHER